MFKKGIFLNCVTRVTEWLLWIGSTKGENLDEEMRMTDCNGGSSMERLEPTAHGRSIQIVPNLVRFSAQEQSCVCARYRKEECVIDKLIHNFG